ncbi:MAG: 50S ribosomal protein L13 [Euryarchaeota archaeon RBG_16_62_10]|nr:MAG: 50S ribosomal protein L13 [Euryarchaeota archaeon RBG_16_62_10]
MTVIDADGLVLGRLCTNVAKRLLNGEEVVVLNAEKAIVSGNRAQLFEFYRHRRKRGKSHLTKGPYYPRTPDRVLKRTVRNMVDYKKPRGRAALKRLKVFIGVPREFAGAKAETVEGARKPNLVKYVSLGEISKELGSSQGLMS